jgi:hypothetical protein
VSAFIRLHQRHRTATWLVLILALILRLPHLNASFWLDEAAQALEVIRPLSQQLDIAGDFQPPLLHLILHFAAYLSHSEWWLRLIGALIPGLITVWGTIKIGEALHHPRTGILAGLLLATSPFHVFFSQELRPYSLPAMFAVLSWLVLLRWSGSHLPRLPWHKTFPPLQTFAAFALLTSAGLYSSYLYPFVLIGQATFMLWSRRDQFLSFFLAALAGSATFLPWLPFFLEQLRVGGELRQALPGWDEVVSLTQLKSIPLVFGKFVFGVGELSADPLILIALVLLASSGGMLVFTAWSRGKLHRSLVPLLFWLIVPLVTAWLVSFVVPVIQPKRVLFLLPALYLSVSLLTSRYAVMRGLLEPNLWQRLTRKTLPLRTHLAAVLLLFTMFSLNILGLIRYYTDADLQREDWRSLFSTVHERFPAADTVVVFSFPEAFAPWHWYEHRARQAAAAQNTTTSFAKTHATGAIHISAVPDLTAQLAPLNNYQTIIVLDYLRTLTDPEDELLQVVTDFGYVGSGVLEYPHIGFTRIYENRN